MLDRPAVNSDDQLHVFGDCVEPESARLDDRFPVKDGEGAGNDQRAFEQVPARPPEEKGAQVFDHLKTLDGVGRQSDLDHLPILDRASVENPHDASAGHRVDARADDRAHEAQQGIAFQHAIRVQRAEVRRPAQVDARVEGVRLAASLLADHAEAGRLMAEINGSNRLGREERPVNEIHPDQIERGNQPLERRVRRAVVNYDDLEAGILGLEDGAHGVHDRVLLVPGWHHNRHRRRDRGFAQKVEAFVSQPPIVQPDGDQGHQHQQRVNAVPRYEIESEQDVENGQGMGEEDFPLRHGFRTSRDYACSLDCCEGAYGRPVSGFGVP